jgi:hypothetical protein
MDHLHDTNLLTLTEAVIPGFIKVANEKPLFYAYSNGIESYFPIDTPSNAWLSAAYFEKNAASHLDKDDFAKTHDTILEALNLHGIDYESPYTVEKVADENEEYTFVKLASDIKVFEQNYKHINPEERHEKAKEILNRYQALKDSGAKDGGSLPKIVEEYAGEHLKKDWPDVLHHRASRVDDREGKEAYHELAESKESKEIILRLLGLLDKKFGLDHHYDRGILDPYRSLLTTEEPKKEKIIIMVVNGKQYDHEKVASLNPLDLAEQFGGEVLSGLTDNPSVYLKSAPEFVKVAVAQVLDAKE